MRSSTRTADWWTAEDYAAFQRKCQAVAEWYDGQEVYPGIACSGALTISENVADLGADVNVLKSAQDEAQRLLKDDPALTKPEHRALRERIDRLFSANSDSFN